MADRRLFQDIADRIVELIREGAFPPGSRLPGERELSERFGVSRVTVREAEIELQTAGWIKIKTGAGVYVLGSPDGAGGDLPKVSAFELTEARSLFEGEAAALAATTIREADIEKLEALLAVMGSNEADEDAINQADREFHLTIAGASGNQAIIYMIQSLWRLRTELPEVRDSHAAVCQQDGAARDAEHREILDALRERDASGARLAMRRHFNRLLESMLAATEQRELEELRRRSAESRARFLAGARLA